MSISPRKRYPYPHQDKRVSSYITDARAFLRNGEKKYDLIIFGLLDSHTMLSSLSNIRLDSFVYTVESFEQSLARLNKEGVLTVTFSLIHEDLGRKLYGMLEKAGGGMPVRAFRPKWNDGGELFATGPGLGSIPWNKLPLNEVTDRYRNFKDTVTLSTDDWPFFYMPTKRFPFSYVVTLALLLGASLVFIRASLRSTNLGAAPFPELGTFFSLGAGFMLVEARAVTELGLLFGNTWFVVAIVIGLILTMAFCANLLVAKVGNLPILPIGLLLVASLGLGWWLNGNATGVPRGVYLLVVGLPLFFSGLVFSSTFQRCSQISMALAANMMGSMFGGMLEYNAMAFGFRSLYVIAIGLYAGAVLFHLAGRSQRLAQPRHGDSIALGPPSGPKKRLVQPIAPPVGHLSGGP